MHPTPDLIGVIPARMASTRLPGKPLRLIAGVAMIERVYRGAAACPLLPRVVVATDSGEIQAFCQARSIPCHLTSPDHPSGTDRVWQVASELGAAAAVNIQGDEPLVRPEMITTLIDTLFAAADTEVATIYTAASAAEAAAPSVCKLVTDERGRALYFSRAAIPFAREGAPAYKKHLGFYAYSRRALDAFHAWPPAPLEEHERLEQLRFLHHGVAIACAATPFDTVGVDTLEDLTEVERILTSPPR